MEAIGTASSVIAVLALTRQVSKAVVRVCERYIEAPRSLVRINRRLQIIEAHTQFLSILSSDALEGKLPLSEKEELLLIQVLDSAANQLSDVLHTCNDVESQFRSKRKRFIWAMNRELELESVLQKLQSTEISLSAVLQVLQV